MTNFNGSMLPDVQVRSKHRKVFFFFPPSVISLPSQSLSLLSPLTLSFLTFCLSFSFSSNHMRESHVVITESFLMPRSSLIFLFMVLPKFSKEMPYMVKIVKFKPFLFDKDPYTQSPAKRGTDIWAYSINTE